MSNVVDSKVVEMRFDNKQFETNVASSMSTLDKLKEKLKLTSSAKSFEEINNAAKKCDMSGLGRGIETVHAKFSALQIMGVTALANITNSAINSGKRIAKALTIDPVKTGLSEYETQINAIQTILANTKKEGTTITDVNRALDELNTYADKTIYNFTEMTRNIGTFTAAGVKLNTSVTAIKGIANLAAVSGSTSQQAATAMYQLSQALASGTVKLMDWNSVVNAGMGGQVFQDALKETARVHGIAIDKMIKDEGSFRETLSKGWLTSEILTETLQKFTMTTEGLTEEQIKANREMLRAKGYTDDQIDGIFKLGETATDAATKVKTFTQMWDVLKEAAQSGWAQTWRLIIGDFEEAKAIFTPLSEFLTDIINRMSKARNTLIEKAFGMNFGDLSKSLSKITDPIKNVTNGAKEITKNIDKVTGSFKDLGTVVDDVILGKFGNGQERFDKLTKAGYDWCAVQNRVNERLGCSKRYTEQQVKAQDKLIKSQNKANKSVSDAEKASNKLNKAQKEQLKKLVRMTDEQVRANGYTEEQIKALDELRKTAEQLGIPLDDFIDKMDEINGRWLFIDSFKNVGKALIKIFKSIGQGFRDVFEPIKPEQLFNAIAALHKFTSQLIISDNTAEKLKRTFRGLFAVIDIVGRLFGGGLRIALTIISSIFKGFGYTVIDATAAIGDMIYKFDEWLKKHDFIQKAVEYLAEKIPLIVDRIKEFIDSLEIKEKAAENFEKIANGIESISEALMSKFKKSLPSFIKLLNAILDGFGTNLADVSAKLAVFITKFIDWLNVYTPLMMVAGDTINMFQAIASGISKCIKAFLKLKPIQAFIADITSLIEGFFESFELKGFDKTLTFAENIIAKINEIFENIKTHIEDLDTSVSFVKGLNLVEGLAEGILSGAKKAISAIANIANIVINKFCEIMGINSPARVFITLGGFIISGLSKGILNGAKGAASAIANIAKIIIDKFCKLLGIHSPSRVFMALGGFIISGLLIGLKGRSGEVFESIKNLFNNITTIACDVLNDGVPKIYDLIKLIGSKMYDTFAKTDIKLNELFVAGSIVSLIALLWKTVNVIEKFSKPIIALERLFYGVTNVLNEFSKSLKVKRFKIIADSIQTLAIAIGILAASVYLLSKIEPARLWSAVGAIAALAAVMAVLAVVVTKFDGLENFQFLKMSVMMISLGITLLMFSKAIKMVEGIETGNAIKSVLSLIAFISAVSGLMYVYGKYLEGDKGKYIHEAGRMMLKIAFALGLMALAIKVIGKMSPTELNQGIWYLGLLMGFVAVLIGVCSYLNENAQYANKVGSMFLRISLSLAIMVGCIKLIGSMDPNDLKVGIAVVSGFMAVVAGFIALSKFAGQFSGSAGLMFLGISAAILSLGVTLRTIAGIKKEDISKAIYAVYAITVLFGTILMASAFTGADAYKAGLLFAGMATALLSIGTCMKILSGLKPADIERGLVVITYVLVLFAAIIRVSEFAGKNAAEAGKMFLTMSAAILILVASIAILSVLDPEDVLRGTVCVSMLLGMFAVLTKVTQYARKTMKDMVVLAAVIALLSGSIIALSFLDPKKVAIASACLAGVLGMFSVLTYMSKYAGGALKTMITITLALGALAGVIYIVAKLPCENAIAAAASLSILLLSLSAAFVICGLAGAMSKNAIISLGIMIVALGLIAGIFAIMQHFNIQPSIEVAKALSILLLAMSGALLILAGVGAIAPYALAGVASLIIAITTIGAFIVIVGNIFKKIEGLSETFDIGIEVLVKLGNGIGRAIGALVDGFIGSVANSLPTFATKLSEFMNNLQPFLDGASKINPGVAESTKNLASALGGIVKADFINSIKNFFFGDDTMTKFCSQLVEFGTAMKKYGDEVNGINCGAITASAEAAKGLTNVANNIPKDDGLAQIFSGNQNISTFGGRLVSFGKSMKAYGDAVNGLNCDAVVASAKAAKGLTNVANNIPKDDGFWQIFTGNQNMATFGSRLATFGRYMMEYSKSVNGLNISAVTTSVKAAKALVSLSNTVAKKKDDTTVLKNFGDSVVTYGKYLKKYGEEIAEVGASNITASVEAGKKLAKFLNELDVDTIGIDNFVSGVNKISKADVSGAVSAFKDSTSSLKSAGKKMSNAVASGMKSSKSNATNAAKSLVSGISGAVSKETSDMKTAGAKLAKSLINGVKSGASISGAKTAMRSLCKAARDAALNYKSKFISVGKSLGDGLKYGMQVKKSEVYYKGIELGARAAAGVKKGADVNSPSKLTTQYGVWLGEGLIVGMKNVASSVYKSGSELGERTANSVSSAISNVASLFSSDIDVQPTIAPVVDLSNVKSGVGAINNMLGQEVMVGANANISAINFGMARINQNGVNGDVVSAIDKLRKDLGNIQGNTYNVNGVTYDDGSNVSNAVKDLVRAARVERRK